MNDVLRENSAFRGMNVSAHYEYWVVPGVVVYDLRDLSFRQTPIDVHTAFLEFAKKMRDAKLKRVELSYRGTTKFSIDGASFRRLGDEYAKRNFDYVLYTFPRLFHSVGGGAPASAVSDRDALLQIRRRCEKDAIERGASGDGEPIADEGWLDDLGQKGDARRRQRRSALRLDIRRRGDRQKHENEETFHRTPPAVKEEAKYTA